MTTNTITGKVTEGNRRVHYGTLTITSTNSVLHYFKTGLRSVDQISVESNVISGNVPVIVHPTSLPALDTSSGNFGVLHSLSSQYIYWRAKGVI